MDERLKDRYEKAYQEWRKANHEYDRIVRSLNELANWDDDQMNRFKALRSALDEAEKRILEVEEENRQFYRKRDEERRLARETEQARWFEEQGLHKLRIKTPEDLVGWLQLWQVPIGKILKKAQPMLEPVDTKNPVDQ